MDILSSDTVTHAALLVSRILIGFYFFFFTFWNFCHRFGAISVMRDLRLPLAPFIFALGLCLQCVTGLLIIFGQYTAISAALLIIFVVFATFIYHRFWSLPPGPVRTLNTIIFIGNFTITLGALLFVIGTAGLV